ncbi:DUF4374 domain-containing protein [Pedobacter steynii]|uniref:DUF4374 domain-containing protein n=1 Tax=Pedobacter steynii TaxID=430522 RepID=A0A1D7QN89_9SPHI|nr:DUF4374 domain-containing protein [Pedobacter steynii]AOM80125.1 hypothetical protein BFS30_24965 [Pedobacter steynii]
MKKNNLFLLAGLAAALTFSSCKSNNKSDDGPGTDVNGRYIISGESATAEESKNYILSLGNLTEGKTTILGNGLETAGSTLVFQNNKVFVFKYNRGNDGVTEVFQLNGNGKIEKIQQFGIKSVNVFLPLKDRKEIIVFNVARNIKTPTGRGYRISTETGRVISDKAIDQKIVYVDGKNIEDQMAHIQGAFQVGNRIYMVFQPINGTAENQWGGSYGNRAYVAIFDMELNFIKTISDNRMPYIGRYYGGMGLAETESGDVYTFSNAIPDDEMPAGVRSTFLKINKNTEEFDKSYFFRVEDLTAGYRIQHGEYVGNNKFVLAMIKRDGTGDKARIGVADVLNKTFSWVSGMPEIPGNDYSMPMFVEKGTAYISVPERASESVIYAINPSDNTAKRGIVVEGVSNVGHIGKLTPGN